MDETCFTNANGDYCLKEDQLTTSIFIDSSSDKGSEYLVSKMSELIILLISSLSQCF